MGAVPPKVAPLASLPGSVIFFASVTWWGSSRAPPPLARGWPAGRGSASVPPAPLRDQACRVWSQDSLARAIAAATAVKDMTRATEGVVRQEVEYPDPEDAMDAESEEDSCYTNTDGEGACGGCAPCLLRSLPCSVVSL